MIVFRTGSCLSGQGASKSCPQQPSQVARAYLFTFFSLSISLVLVLLSVHKLTYVRWMTCAASPVREVRRLCEKTVPFFYPEKSGSIGTEIRYA